jgi:glycosyltransferase involved in cell wall biosynthesis|tara:strand:+ start:125 stop:799 length:675 start_codon:yes stop_codon:yes gene_type:complete
MISFVVPAHNYGYSITKCISSILKNEKKFIKEIIIINDSSNDDTDLIIKKLKKKIKKIKYYKKKFKNLSKSMNFGISKTSGNFICKIDADDTISPLFAKKTYEYLLKSKSDFIYPNLIINDNIMNLKYIKKQKPNFFIKNLFYPCGSGCLYKKDVWKKVGGYNQKIFYQDDYDFWLKVKKLKGIKINHLDKALYIYNKHSNNMSKNILKKNLTKIKIFIQHILN